MEVSRMNYMTITHEDMVNGPGLREVLWVSGCEHKCPGCHNPETWAYCAGKEFTQDVREELFRHLDNDFISGLTISGGDPFAPKNIDTITDICREFRRRYNRTKVMNGKPVKTLWVYTGYTFDDIKDYEALKYIDVLIDGEFKASLYSPLLDWKGSSNQRVIDVRKTLKGNGKVVIFNYV